MTTPKVRTPIANVHHVPSVITDPRRSFLPQPHTVATLIKPDYQGIFAGSEAVAIAETQSIGIIDLCTVTL